MKTGNPPLQSVRVLDQLRERIRYMHYSLSTEQVYMYWVRFFIRWSARGGSMRHPREMGAADVEAFLTMLATQRKVSASTHNQALNAILFLYREVLGVALPWLDNVNRPTQKRRIPRVLTKDEMAGLLAHIDGPAALVARLLNDSAKPGGQAIRSGRDSLGEFGAPCNLLCDQNEALQLRLCIKILPKVGFGAVPCSGYAGWRRSQHNR